MAYHRQDIPSMRRMQVAIQLLNAPERKDRYGRVRDIARELKVSRQLIYSWLDKGRRGLESSLTPGVPGPRPRQFPLVVDQRRLQRAIVTLRVLAHASMRGVKACVEEILDMPVSLGKVVSTCQEAQQRAQAFQESLCPPDPASVDLDEMYDRSTPYLSIVESQSLLTLATQKVSQLNAGTWGAELLGLLDRGVELADVATDVSPIARRGLKEAGLGELPQQLDIFHLFHDLQRVRLMLENAAYRAIGREHQVVGRAEAEAKGRRWGGRPPKHGLSVAEARKDAQSTIERHDNYAWLMHELWLILRPVHFGTGKVHSDGWMMEQMKAVGALIDEIDSDRESIEAWAMRKAANNLRKQIPFLITSQRKLTQKLGPWQQELGEETVALICWAWTWREPLGLQEEEGKGFEPHLAEAVDSIWETLGELHRTTSSVESWHSFVRPYVKVQRGLSQQMLTLLAFYYNHHRFERGTHEGLSPVEWSGLRQRGDWLSALGFAKTPRDESRWEHPPTELVPMRVAA